MGNWGLWPVTTWARFRVAAIQDYCIEHGHWRSVLFVGRIYDWLCEPLRIRDDAN